MCNWLATELEVISVSCRSALSTALAVPNKHFMSFAISSEVEGELVFPDFKSSGSDALGISCGLKPHWLVFFQSGPERGIYD